MVSKTSYRRNSFSFSSWNLALTFLPFVFRIDMHTHFAAPQKRGYTHTLGLAPLPREPIDTSISNHGFPMHKHMMATMLRARSLHLAKLDWIGRGICWRQWWRYTLSKCEIRDLRTPPQKKSIQSSLGLFAWKKSRRFFLGGEKILSSPIFWRFWRYGFDFQKKFRRTSASFFMNQGGFRYSKWQLCWRSFPPYNISTIFFHTTRSCRCVK